MLKNCFSISLVLFLSACAGSYHINELDDSAVLSIKHSLAVFPSSTTVNIFDNSACENNEGSGRLAKVGNDTMIKDKALDVKIKAGEVVYLASQLWKESGSERYGYITYQCNNLISFTAVKDGQYSFVAKALKNGDCVIELLEKSSQLPPLDMRVLQSKAACNNTGMLDFF